MQQAARHPPVSSHVKNYDEVDLMSRNNGKMSIVVRFGADDEQTPVEPEPVIDQAIGQIQASAIKPEESVTVKALEEQEDENGAGEQYTHLAEVADMDKEVPNILDPHMFTKYPVAYAEFKKDLKAKLPNMEDDRIPKLFEKIFTLEFKRGVFMPARKAQTDDYWYNTVRGRMHAAFRLDNFDPEWAWLAGYQAHGLIMHPLNYFGSDK